MSTPWNPNYKRKSKTYTSSEVKNRYNSKTYDAIGLRVHKGGRDVIKSIADSKGMSVNSYILHLIIADNPENAEISRFIGGGGSNTL